jgi:hypothetical protein
MTVKPGNLMRALIYFIALIFLVGIMSCDFSIYASDYDFVMNAVYIEPISHARAFVSTIGYVPVGEDLGDPATATINAKIVFEKSVSDTFCVIATGEIVQYVHLGKLLIPIKDSNFTHVLIELCKKNSIVQPPDSSLQEFADVILSTGNGPKGTYFKGQTKTILVDTVYETTHFR